MYLKEQTINEVFDTLVMSAKEEGEDHIFTYMDRWYIESFIYGLSLAQGECVLDNYTKEQLVNIYVNKVREYVGKEEWEYYLEEEDIPYLG